MKRRGVIHDKLSYALATMGHDDLLIVTDAGMPFKRDDERTIDLALAPDVPDIFTVLRAIRQDLWVEKFAFIAEGRNPNVVNGVSEIFPDAESTTMPNDWFHHAVDNTAKWVVRSGAWTPWGNVALWSGIPVAEWMSSTGAEPPQEWDERLRLNREHGNDGVR
ncbi:RbsD/FucU domain-containing protein [Ruania rhizosphaerae]|uniref:RbsD/FucU domain-containing protein n=1 Tax=Ruania rhizosphaerae TaxID=1840413 RepID=UPI00135CCED3|nr:RbsD/FucU family protein [Ruania rhizosphaerae]